MLPRKGKAVHKGRKMYVVRAFGAGDIAVCSNIRRAWSVAVDYASDCGCAPSRIASYATVRRRLVKRETADVGALEAGIGVDIERFNLNN